MSHRAGRPARPATASESAAAAADAAAPLGAGAAGASGRVFAFRADHEMVAALSSMHNASEFIRKAIQRSLEEPCPVCEGRGVVAPGFRGEIERLGGHFVLRRCDCCANEYPAPCPTALMASTGTDRLRHELAVARGENVCAACLDRAPPCAACGKVYALHAVTDFVRHWRAEHCGRALVTTSRRPSSAATPSAPPKKRRSPR